MTAEFLLTPVKSKQTLAAFDDDNVSTSPGASSASVSISPPGNSAEILTEDMALADPVPLTQVSQLPPTPPSGSLPPMPPMPEELLPAPPSSQSQFVLGTPESVVAMPQPVAHMFMELVFFLEQPFCKGSVVCF